MTAFYLGHVVVDAASLPVEYMKRLDVLAGIRTNLRRQAENEIQRINSQRSMLLIGPARGDIHTATHDSAPMPDDYANIDPLKRAELMKLWTTITGRDNWVEIAWYEIRDVWETRPV